MTLEISLKQRYLVANLIGLAMVASVFIYAVVVEVMQRALAPFTGLAALSASQVQVLKYVLVGLALGHFFLLKSLPKVLAPPTAARLFLTAILTFALCEAVALYGLVFFLLSGRVFDFYLFFALSLFYFYFFYPKYQEWEQLLGAGSGEPVP